MDLKALADRKDPVVWLERLVLLENVVLKAPPVPMEFRERKEPKEIPESLAHQDSQALAVFPVKLEILDRWDLRVDRAPLVFKVSAVQ